MAILSARHLTKTFDRVAAVSDASFEVHAGEVVGLLGPNGAGKTTTLRMLAGILTPDAGSVMVDGLDIHRDPLRAKSRVGFLTGDTQLYQRLSAREVLEYFARLYGLDPTRSADRIGTLLDDLDMRAFADRPCHTLSAGQKQRANIARAFLHDPPLLVLDEPTTALDVISGRFIVDAIRAAKDSGKAVLFSTHIMSEAEYVCDRLLMMHGGEIIERGAVNDILHRTGQASLTHAFLALVGAR